MKLIIKEGRQKGQKGKSKMRNHSAKGIFFLLGFLWFFSSAHLVAATFDLDRENPSSGTCSTHISSLTVSSPTNTVTPGSSFSITGWLSAGVTGGKSVVVTFNGRVGIAEYAPASGGTGSFSNNMNSSGNYTLTGFTAPTTPGAYRIDFEANATQPSPVGACTNQWFGHVSLVVAPPTQPNPTADIKANGSDGPITVVSGSMVTLNWNAVNANGNPPCTASWGTANRAATGSDTSQSPTANTNYSITCRNSAGQTATDSVTVNIQAPPPTPGVPTVLISADPNPTNYNTASNISWSSQNASACSVSKSGTAWKTGTLGANISSGNLTAATEFAAMCVSPSRTITCTNSMSGNCNMTCHANEVATYIGGCAWSDYISSSSVTCGGTSNGPTTGQVSCSLPIAASRDISCTNSGSGSCDMICSANETAAYLGGCASSSQTSARSVQCGGTSSYPTTGTVSCTAVSPWAAPVMPAPVTTHNISCSNNMSENCDMTCNAGEAATYLGGCAWASHNSASSIRCGGTSSYPTTGEVQCSSFSQSATSSVTVNINPVALPTLTFWADQTTVPANTPANLKWTTTNATSCTATGGNGTWAGNRGSAHLGSGYATAPIAGVTTFSLACSGPGGTTETKQVTINTISIYRLSATTSGTGTGTVSSSPAGINCGGACSADFDSGTRVTLTALPSSGSTFTGWSGACSGSTCTVTMSSNKTVNAEFALTPPSLKPVLVAETLGCETQQIRFSTPTSGTYQLAYSPSGSGGDFLLVWGPPSVSLGSPVLYKENPGASSSWKICTNNLCIGGAFPTVHPITIGSGNTGLFKLIEINTENPNPTESEPVLARMPSLCQTTLQTTRCINQIQLDWEPMLSTNLPLAYFVYRSNTHTTFLGFDMFSMFTGIESIPRNVGTFQLLNTTTMLTAPSYTDTIPNTTANYTYAIAAMSYGADVYGKISYYPFRFYVTPQAESDPASETCTSNGTIRVKRVGSDHLITSAPAGSQSKIDALALTAANPVDFANLSAGEHLTYSTDAAGYSEVVGTCTYPEDDPEGDAECGVASLITVPTCDGTLCSHSVTVANGVVTKIVYKYVLKPIPPLNVSCSGTALPNRQIQWDATVTGGTGPYQFLWTGKASGTSRNPLITYGTYGVKDSQVQVTASNGETKTSPPCSVNLPAPDVIPSCSASPNPANIGDEVTWTGSATGGTGTYSYSWSGAVSGTGSLLKSTYNSAGAQTSILTVTSGPDTQTTSCSVNIPQPDVEHCNFPPGPDDHVATYVAPRAGCLKIDTDGSDFDTGLAVYTTVRGEKILVACNNNCGVDKIDSATMIETAAGTVYEVHVVNISGDAIGNVQIHYSVDDKNCRESEDPPPPAAAVCTGPMPQGAFFCPNDLVGITVSTSYYNVGYQQNCTQNRKCEFHCGGGVFAANRCFSGPRG